MTNDERLNLRARQLLDDPTLGPNQRIANAAALLKQLAIALRQSGRLDDMLAEITDLTVREQMRAAIEAA